MEVHVNLEYMYHNLISRELSLQNVSLVAFAICILAIIVRMLGICYLKVEAGSM